MQLQPILKIFYDSLKNDRKILGLKCKECGAVQFPPVPVCNDCGCMDTEWVEMSGEGELLAFAYNNMGIQPFNDDCNVIGYVRLKEGMLMNSQILGMDEDDQPALLERMQKGETIKVALEVGDLDESVSYPMIKIVN